MKSSISPLLNIDLLEQEYWRWQKNNSNIDSELSAFFEGFELGLKNFDHNRNGSHSNKHEQNTHAPKSESNDEKSLNANLFSLIYAYRSLGHLSAHLDPLNVKPETHSELSHNNFGFTDADLDTVVSTPYYKENQEMKLSDLIASLQADYSDKIGFEYMHIQNREIRYWLRDKIENRPRFTDHKKKEKIDALTWILEAEVFEQFLHKKYLGEKRFSLEGGESTMVALNSILINSPKFNVKEIVMGMAHRGRLNVLANFLKKPLKNLFYEFSEKYVPLFSMGDGDVKYHLGFETTRNIGKSKIDIYLAANPSHLEAVNSVVEGKARARQRIINDTKMRSKVLPILLHGDAAFAGQGSVAEVIHQSQLPGYRTGGTIHIIINNQIGFTTLPSDARSSAYCSDVAKMSESPIFHVNGDHPLEVLYVTELALEFRQHFKMDVFIDLYCYRRRGHNENDLAGLTQPDYDKKVKNHKFVSEIFLAKLANSKELTKKEGEKINQEIWDRLNREYKKSIEQQNSSNHGLEILSNAETQPEYSHAPIDTGIPITKLKELGKKLATVPKGFKVHPTLAKRFFPQRIDAIKNGGPYNWAHAETLSFASLLIEGTPVRLSGQDCERGSFSQRHVVLYDFENNEKYVPLRALQKEQASFCVYNSSLSEAGILGFDYGYSLITPNMLIMWEAQFGDFSNGAQVIIDQFISSSESKWGKPSRIVLLLPHGYEGMGPEHSSARLERYLQLCAHDNMQVCNLTTPAQYFHVLRRQMKQPFKKPLVIMTPKSLLNHASAISHDADFDEGKYFLQIMIDPETYELPPESRKLINRIIFCSGKVYYDLIEYRKKHPKIKNTSIIRIEQLYPFSDDLLQIAVSRYPNAHKWVWCQEEPQNMGAWSFIAYRLNRHRGHRTRVRYAGRQPAASPATGSKYIHNYEQKKLVESAFNV